MDIERKYMEGLKRDSYKDFTRLYDIYSSRLYAFVYTMTQSSFISKDIVQETFIKVWLQRKTILPEKSFKSYLFMIARNQLLNELRRHINMETKELEDLTGYAENNTEQKLHQDDFNKCLENAKKKLTPRQREFFEMNKEYGLSIAEIADKTDISEQSVRNQLSQALAKLRKEMKHFHFLFSIFFLT